MRSPETDPTRPRAAQRNACILRKAEDGGTKAGGARADGGARVRMEVRRQWRKLLPTVPKLHH